MAEGKKGFILYTDLTSTVKKLILKDRERKTNNAGELFYHILQYVSDENPEPVNDTIDIVFEQIKMQLKRDLVKYEEVKSNKSNGGRLGNLKRWNIDLYNDVIDKKITLEEAEKIAISRKVSHTDTNLSHTVASVAVNDNVNVIMCNNVLYVNDSDISFILKETKYFNTREISDEFLIRLIWENFKGKVNTFEKDCKNFLEKANGLKLDFLTFFNESKKIDNLYFQSWINKMIPKRNDNDKKFNFKTALIDYGFDSKLVDEWLQVRKEKKAVNTETAFNAFITEIKSRQCDINDMLRIAVENSWSGFKYKWVDNLNLTKQNYGNGQQQSKEQPVIGRMSEETVNRNLQGW